MTISEALSLSKMVRERLGDLKSLRSEVSISTTQYYGGDDRKIVEPKFSVEVVDARISELQLWLTSIDIAIKTANQSTILSEPLVNGVVLTSIDLLRPL